MKVRVDPDSTVLSPGEVRTGAWFWEIVTVNGC